MERVGKLSEWRNKTEAQKHRIALTGAVIFCVAVVLVWGANFIFTIKNRATETDQVAVVISPAAGIKEVVGDNFKVIKDQAGAIWSGAASVLTSDLPREYVSTSTDQNN